MSIYAFADIEDGRAVRINANVSFPSRQDGNMFMDCNQSVNLKFADELPLHIENFFSVVAFRPSHVILSRDILGGKPLYYNPHMLAVSSFKSYLDQPLELLPGETVKIDYHGEILSRSRYKFEEVFKPIEDPLKVLDRTLRLVRIDDACLAFSGGVDSSLIAALYDIPLISATANREEKKWIEEAADKLGKEVEILMFGENEVVECLPHVISTIETCDPLQVSIAIPVYLILKHSHELGYHKIMFGQGADELFGGYKRYEEMDSKELEPELVEDIKNMGEHNLIRDTKLAYDLKMQILHPYLHWDVIRAALSISPEQKVRKTPNSIIRKSIFREYASRYLPEDVAYKDKKAVQYSTKTSNILKKLAKREGLNLEQFLRKFCEQQ